MANKKIEIFTEEAGYKITILGIGILAVVFIAGLALQYVWTTPMNSNTENANNQEVTNSQEIGNLSNLEFGQYIQVNNGEERILKEYFSKIFMTLSSGTAEEVYNITATDYIKKNNYNPTSLYNHLKNKGIVGKAFECTKYSVANNPRFGRVFSLEMNSIDNKIIDKLIIIEESPRHYKVSFEEYIGKKDQDIELIREGLKLNILSVEEYKDRVYFNIKLENVSNDVIVINNDERASEPISVILSNQKTIYSSKDWFMASSRTLKPNQSVESTVVFYIIDLQSSKIQKMKIIDVYNETSKSTANFEYQIY